MKQPSLPYLEKRTKRMRAGRVTYWYFRRRGQPLVRLPDPSEPDFLSAYRKAADGRPEQPSKRNIAALVDSYRASLGYAEKRARTRADYDPVLDHIKATAGQHDVSKITMPALIAAMERNRHRIRFANYLAQLYRILCKHAIKLGWMTVNPLTEVELLRTPPEKQKPHLPWTDAAVAKWRAEAKPMALLAMELGIGTAQRPGDLPNLRWSAYDGESLTIEQSKTGAIVTVPCTPELQAALNGIEKRGLTILTNAKGQPLTGAAFGSMMAAERERLGTMAYDLHGMRYRGVMELAWAGCDDDEIMAFSGHATKAMVALYAGKARQIMRARQAAKKRQERNGART